MIRNYIFAYLDPTTGSTAYQIVISSMLAAAAAGRIYWRQLKQFFAKIGKR